LRIKAGRLRQLLLESAEHPGAGLLRLLGTAKLSEGLALWGLGRWAGHALLLELGEGLLRLLGPLLLPLLALFLGHLRPGLLAEERANPGL